MDFAIFWGVSAVNIQRHLHEMFLPGVVQVLHFKIINACIWELFCISLALQRDSILGEPKLLGIELEVGVGGIWGCNVHLLHPLVSHNAHRTQGVQHFLWQIPEWIFQEATLLVLDKLQLTFLSRCCSKHVEHKEPQKHAFHFGTRKWGRVVNERVEIQWYMFEPTAVWQTWFATAQSHWAQHDLQSEYTTTQDFSPHYPNDSDRWRHSLVLFTRTTISLQTQIKDTEIQNIFICKSIFIRFYQ